MERYLVVSTTVLILSASSQGVSSPAPEPLSETMVAQTARGGDLNTSAKRNIRFHANPRADRHTRAQSHTDLNRDRYT